MRIRAEAAIGGALLAIFAALRLPLFTTPGLRLGWNSDAALFGLMARAAAEGWDVPLFFWGQSYLGTITALGAAALARIFGPSHVGPMTLRLAVALEVLIGIALYWRALRRVVGRGPAMLAAAWLVAGPAFVFFFVIAPIGAEQLFFTSAVLFWFATRASFESRGQWLILGLISGAGLWVHQGIAIVIVGVAVALFAERRLSAARVAWAGAGAAIGYVPAIVWWLGDHPILYRRTLMPWHPSVVWENVVDTIRSDAWLLLADQSWIGIVTAVTLFTFAAVALRRVEWSRGSVIMLTTIIAAGAFWIFSNYRSAGAVRYIVPVVPFFYAFAAAGIARSRNVWAVLAAIFITGALYVPRYAEARSVAAGRSEQYADWPGGFDPRPTLRQMRAGGYRVCYGEAWVGHKLEWISEPTVRFVPVRIVHRTLPQSLGLIAQPGPKCFVENDGTVRRLSAAEEAKWRDSVVQRARKARLLP